METLEIIPVVMILTGVIKNFLPKEYIALSAVLMGLALSLAFNQDVVAILNGVLGGLGAVGTYSLSKGAVSKSESTIEALKDLIKE